MFAITVFALAYIAVSHGHPMLEAFPEIPPHDLGILVPRDNGYDTLDLPDFDDIDDDGLKILPMLLNEILKTKIDRLNMGMFDDSDDDDTNEIESRFIRRRRSTSELDVDDVKPPSKWKRRFRSAIDAVKEILKNSPEIIRTIRDALVLVREIKGVIREGKTQQVDDFKKDN